MRNINMFILIVVFALSQLNNIVSQETSSDFLTFADINESSPLINARCFWVYGYENIYDLSNLTNWSDTVDLSFVAKDNAVVYYNFCKDAIKTCRNTSALIVSTLR